MAAGALLTPAVAVVAGCNGSPSAPDRESPEVRIVFPAAGEYDRDGDGLVDIEIEFTDPDAGVDSASVAVESSRALGPAAQSETDLLRSFRVVARDTARLVLEETTDALLPSGEVEIVVRVSDRAGNEAVASRTVDLPAGAFHTRLPLPILDDLDPVGIVMLPDGATGFVPLIDGRVVPFDPRTVELLSPIEEVFPTNLGRATYEPRTQRIYISNRAFPFIHIFDPVALRFDGFIQVSARNIGIEAAPSGLLYVAIAADAFQALVGVVDPVTRREIRRLELGFTNELNPGEPAWVETPRSPPEEDRLYVPLGVEPFGLLVVDPVSGEVERIIDIDPSTESQGDALESVLDPVRRRLYLTELFGLTEVDIDTDRTTRRIDVRPRKLKFLSLSPSGRRLFVTGSGLSAGVSSESWLVDVDSFTILARFEVADLPAGENSSVFRPDGQLIFVNHGEEVAVYLNREP